MIQMTEEFLAELERYTPALSQQVRAKIALLERDPSHPSLNAHRIHAHEGMWECYVNRGYRIIYDRQGEDLRLWKLGPHVIIDRVAQASFAAHTDFRRFHLAGEEGPSGEPAAAPGEGAPTHEYAAAPAATGSPNRLRDLPPAHLRILGVPPGLVKAVQRAPNLEALEQIEGLPPQSLAWLLELLTDPDLERIVFDEGRLLFRTTLDRLEGYCTGSIRQLMLNLTPEQQQYVTPTGGGTTLLRGVAGSGKTTVGLYRAIELASQGRRVLLLTYSRTLNAVTRSLIESVIGPLPENLEVVNIDRWIHGFLASRNIAPAPMDDAECLPHLAAALEEVRATGSEAVLGQRIDFFRDEIARVIKGAPLSSLDQYQAVERYGRRTALHPTQRAAVWRVYEAYEQRLAHLGRCDWRDPVRMAYEHLLEAPLDQPYDDVIVDEAQDLTATQLRLVQRLIRGRQWSADRSLLILGDAAQTIYARGFSWRQAGIAARGRTFLLRRNHRNTRQILQAAARLLEQNRLMRAGEEYIAPEATRRMGPLPIIIECDLADRERRAVRERLLELVSDGHFRPSDFAVLAPRIDLCEAVRDDLTGAGLNAVLYRDEEFNVLEEQVKILTIHSAKGLEFPVVFVLGLREGILPQRPPIRLDEEERELEVERQRTLLYVAMTRAAEALYLVTAAPSRSGFLNELGETVRTAPFARP